jgi:RNA polymerase sigma factor (sigma-70 family)
MLNEVARARLEYAYREVGDDMWRAILAWSGGRRDVADEAVAEAFSQAARRMGDIRELHPWLFKAAFRIAAGELQRRSKSVFLDDVEGETTDDLTMADFSDLARSLSPTQRRAFVLRDLLGYPTPDVAELLGISQVAVRVHLHGARKRLRVDLEQEALS